MSNVFCFGGDDPVGLAVLFFFSVSCFVYPFVVFVRFLLADAGGVVPELCRERFRSGGRAAQAIRVGTGKARGNPWPRPRSDHEGKHIV